jgi:hypothetical protein
MLLFKLTRILMRLTYTLKVEAEFTDETSEALPTSTSCKDAKVESTGERPRNIQEYAHSVFRSKTT